MSSLFYLQIQVVEKYGVEKQVPGCVKALHHEESYCASLSRSVSRVEIEASLPAMERSYSRVASQEALFHCLSSELTQLTNLTHFFNDFSQKFIKNRVLFCYF